MAAYLGYTLRTKTLFHGQPFIAHETHTRRRSISISVFFFVFIFISVTRIMFFQTTHKVP